ncbi:MAG: cytochrome c [Anaerolineae bacterium]|nr:cytochrome c [Anaerolineae bacterium]
MKKRARFLGLSLILIGLMLAACGPSPTPTAMPTATPAVSPTPLPAEVMVVQGQTIYETAGCASCHGQDGEGLDGLGPALAGHSRAAVFQQVRDPRQVPEGDVQMPAYGSDQLSDEDLEKIVAWIESLGPPMGAGPFVGSMTETAHLRLALISLQAEGVDDAVAHLEDLVATAEGETREQAQSILDLLEQGELHDAEHELEIMLAEAEGGDLTEVQLHIVLALNALQGHNDEDAVRHIENAVGVASGGEKVQLEALLEDLRAGEAHDVEHELERLLGEEPHEL